MQVIGLKLIKSVNMYSLCVLFFRYADRSIPEVSMGLTNDAKDVVGLLRGVNLIIVLWNSDNMLFPLDNEFKRIVSSHRDNLESLLGVICRICQMQEEVEELHSAIEDLVPEVERPHYTEEYLTSLLSLFSGVEALQSFSFSSRSELHRQTKPIFFSLLSRLAKAMLWVRVSYFDMNPDLSLPDLCVDLNLLYSALAKLCPPDVVLPSKKNLIINIIDYWRNSHDVKHGLELTKNEPGNGLYRIADELRSCIYRLEE